MSSEPLDPRALARGLAHPRAGALATFEGWVRDHNEGQPVRALDYEAYPELAEKEGARVVTEAQARFAVVAIVAAHRVGALAIGDLAVWVGVTAEHRAAAFDACRYVIDELKARVPIWKKEHYTSGASQWINCATRGEFADPASPATRPDLSAASAAASFPVASPASAAAPTGRPAAGTA